MTDRNALQFYDLGFHALVSVVPPKAPVAAHSKIKQEDAGKVPGRRNAHGEYVGYNWMTHEPERQEVHQWLLDGSNVGLGAWSYPAIDIDVTDEKLAQLAVKAVEKVMGPCVLRRGRFPKALLIFRSSEPLRSFDVRYEGEHDHPLIGRVRHLIQFLGQGRQYVIDGIHPVTEKPYTIEDPLGAFSDKGPEALPELTVEKVAECFEAIAKIFGMLGYEPNTSAQARLTAEDVTQDSLKAPNIEDLAYVVHEIPNETPDRDEYVAVGYAIRGASQDNPAAGLDIFQEWCSRWTEGYNDPELVEQDWAKMAPPYRTGYGWLLDKGRQWGADMARWEFGSAEAPPEGYEPPVASEGGSEGADPSQNASFTEIDLADEFSEIYSGRILTVPDLDNATYTWNGKSWERRSRHYIEQEVREFLKRKARQVPMMVEGDTKQAEIIGRIKRYATVKNIAHQVINGRRLSVEVDEVDSDVDVLNTPSGPYCLRTGRALEPDRTKPLLRCTTVSPDPDAHCPRWREFIREVTQGDPEMMVYLQNLAGYALTGHTREQIFPFFLGTGGNGKSMFIEVLTRIWGDYAASVPVDLFQTKKTGGGNAAHEYYLADLVGARLVTTSETKSGGYWDEHRVKQLTGEDKVHGRMPYGRPFTFDMRATLIVIGNYAPELESVGEAMARRLHLVPWNFQPIKRDLRLSEKLKAELPGILAWSIEGAVQWQQHGLPRPAAVESETFSYIEDQDVVGNWMEDCIEVDMGAANRGEQIVSTQRLYENYQTWKSLTTGRAMGYHKFVQLVAPRLLAAGAARHKDRETRQRGWKGVKVSDPQVLPPNVSRFPGAEPPPAPVAHTEKRR